MSMYRIGDFARELGVTPDFLKYCEKNGFLQPRTQENGYRFFDFRQSALAIEYLKMKNQGYHASEIREAIHQSSFDGLLQQMNEKSQELRKMIFFQQELLKYYAFLNEAKGYFEEKPVWFIRRVEGFYFLPHSREENFFCDDATRERVRDWNRWLPVVMSTNKIRENSYGRLSRHGNNEWGFSVSEHFARGMQLLTDGPVEYVAEGRFLEVFFVRNLAAREKRLGGCVERLLEQNGLKTAGCAYSKVVAKLWEDGVRKEYGVLYVPVKDAI